MCVGNGDGTHHDLDERVCDEVEAGELGDVPGELDDLGQRVERARLDHDEDRAAIDGSVRAADGAERARSVPDAAGDEGGDEYVVGERERVLRGGEAGEVGDEDGVARADAGKEGHGRLWEEEEEDCQTLHREQERWDERRTARPKAVVARSMRMGIMQT